MKVFYADKKKGVKIKIDCLDDLWYVFQILDKRDLVGGETTRSVRKNELQDARRIKIFVKIEVEKVDFEQFSPVLRVGGLMLSGPEDISRGYHSLRIGKGSLITIEKKGWSDFQVGLVQKAEKESRKPQVLICAFEVGQATFGIMTGQGLKRVGEFSQPVSRREKDYEKKKEGFYKDLWGKVVEIMKSKGVDKVVMAGTGFHSENFEEVVKPGKVFYDKINDSDWKGILEVLRRGTIKNVISSSRLEQEEELISEFLGHLNKDDGLASYGLKEVKDSAEAGAVRELMVLDIKVHDDEVKELIRLVEEGKGGVNLFSSETEPGQSLNGFGGVAGILRFRQA